MPINHSIRGRVAVAAVAAGIAFAIGATPAYAKEILINESEGASETLTAEVVPAGGAGSDVADAPVAAEADETVAPSGSEPGDISDDVTPAGDMAVNSGSASESGAGADSKADSADGPAAEKGDGTGAGSEDGEAADETAATDVADAEAGSNKAADADKHGEIDGTADAEADQAVALTAESTPWYGWYTDASGVRYWYEEGRAVTEHAFYDSGTDKWYWADADGSIARNKDTYIPLDNNAEAGDWRNNGQGKWVRISDDYSMVKGEDYRVSKDDGQWHWWYFDTCTSQMLKNFVHVDSNGGKWVFYDDTYGWMVYGEQCRMTKDNPDWGYGWYYFDDWTGATTYGYKWLSDASDSYYGGKTVYYDTATGRMVYGWQAINGTWNYFDTATGRQCASTNAAHDAWEWLNWAGGSAGATNDVYVMVDKGRLRTMVFRQVNGSWIPMQDYLCSVASSSGNHGAGTIEGFWHLGLLTNDEKGITNGSVYDHSSSGYGAQIDNFQNAGSTGIVWSGPAIAKIADDRFANTSYRYHYLEDQGIHSVVHSGGDEDSQLGQRNTDGCVRLSTVNAKWIFDWVPMNTTIRIYSDVARS